MEIFKTIALKVLQYLCPQVLTSAYNSKTHCHQGTQPPELQDRDREQNEASTVQEGMFGELLCNLDQHKSMRLDRIHSRVLRELAEKFTKPLSIIFQQSWSTR